MVEVEQKPFTPASWYTKIEFINHLFQCNNVLIAVLGEQGSGKTTFLDRVAMKLDPHIHLIRYQATSLFARKQVTQPFQMLFNTEEELTMGGIVALCKQAAKPILLMIDDAHHLPMRFIDEMLQALQLQEEPGYLHVCLASNYSLFRPLKKFAQEIYPDMIHSLEIGPLTEEETQSYLYHQGDLFPGFQQLLTKPRIRQFYRLTEGFLLDIQNQMTTFFKKEAIKEKRLFRPKKLLPMVGGLGLMALGVLLMKPFWLKSQKQIVAQEMPAPHLESLIPHFTYAALRHPMIPVALKKSELFPISELKPKQFEPVIDRVVVTLKPTLEELKIAKLAQIKAAKIVAQYQIPEFKVKPKNNTQLAVKSKDTISKHARYTIQLMASRNKEILVKFAMKHHIENKTKYQTTLREGALWYVLTFGEYKGKLDAEKAVALLPKSVIKDKPWIRRTENLKRA